MKTALYSIALILMLGSFYFVYQWFVAEPANREPLPALLSLGSTIILTIIAWRVEGGDTSKTHVSKIEASDVDINQKDSTEIKVTKVKDNSTISINKGGSS